MSVRRLNISPFSLNNPVNESWQHLSEMEECFLLLTLVYGVCCDSHCFLCFTQRAEVPAGQ